MIRGEIWAAAGGDVSYAGKPRPYLVIQGLGFEALESIVLIGFTSQEESAPFRPAFAPSADNGLQRPSWLMIDKIVTLPKRRLHQRLGTLSRTDMDLVDEALLTILGLA